MPGEPLPQVILVDTSAYFALVDRSDRHHAAAVGFVRSNAVPLATTDLIVVEALNLTRVRLATLPRFGSGGDSSIPPSPRFSRLLRRT